MEELKTEVEKIKDRNARVEADKAWETSWTRRMLVAFLTYLVIVIFFLTVKVPRPFINAIVPTLGFVLSTLSISYVKKLWLKKYYKNS
ncbi:MAG: hypothetical protein WCW77_01950 [Patescibacteria group bacterium]|jgi:polyferredoxin